MMSESNNLTVRFLPFENEVAQVEEKMRLLQQDENKSAEILITELAKLKKNYNEALKRAYENLGPWDVCQIARHERRPQAKNYIDSLFTGFVQVHGDQKFGDDPAMIAGFGFFGDQAIAVLAQQKGRETKDKIKHNFGMCSPEGYRKALRLMQLAAPQELPLVCLIDTPGAYPGIEAEERGQARVIGECLSSMLDYPAPVISIIIGEGGSGGALALASGDHVAMLSNSIYAVISPEGCASILWKDANCAQLAAEAMQLTSKSLLAHKLIDGIIKEPVGAAHRFPQPAIDNLRDYLSEQLGRLQKDTAAQLIQARYKRWRQYGSFKQ